MITFETLVYSHMCVRCKYGLELVVQQIRQIDEIARILSQVRGRY